MAASKGAWDGRRWGRGGEIGGGRREGEEELGSKLTGPADAVSSIPLTTANKLISSPLQRRLENPFLLGALSSHRRGTESKELEKEATTRVSKGWGGRVG